MGSPRLQIGVAAARALSRQSVRDSCTASSDIELSVISSTAAGVLARRKGGNLDRIVLDLALPDAVNTIAELVDTKQAADLLVMADEPRSAARRLGLRSHQVIATPTSDAAFGPAVVQHVRASVPSLANNPKPATGRPSRVADPTSFKRREIVVLGCSTGGPEALQAVLRQLPGNFPVPIVVVQHMPPTFTRLLAERLDTTSALTVREVSEPVTAKAGEVWIAPGDRHIVLTNSAGRIELDDGPEENSCKPSVDVLFRSAATTYGRRAVSVILTGMGDDGCRSARLLVDEGAHLIAQNQATSIVWGMPGAVVKAGLADVVVPLSQVASEICDQFVAVAGGKVNA